IVHLFLLSQWNLVCRSKSVETLHLSHLHSADDSVICVLHKTTKQAKKEEVQRSSTCLREPHATIMLRGARARRLPNVKPHAGAR
ncbi:hypothetical protein JG687_00012093, partial [Phytophthora cactorum]